MMYYLPVMLYRTKSPTPKSKLPAPEKPTRPLPPVVLPLLVKINFTPGLKPVVLEEMAKHPELIISENGEDKLYLEAVADFKNIISMRSILNAYIVKRGEKFNPYYISNHKAIIGDLIDIVLGKIQMKNGKPVKKHAGGDEKNKQVFKTFKLRCAGSQTKEVSAIQAFITSTYKLTEAEEADMEIYINKPNELWEVLVRLTPRPLSLRDYRVANIKGGLNPTIAYAMNTYGKLKLAKSYLNVFSGSGTLLIEAGLTKSKLKLNGFDIDGKNNALAVQNIKKAGMIKQIQLKTADIFNNPDLGKFDVITSDLPFGMQISRDEDLEKLYQSFVNYSEDKLNQGGRLVVYTTGYKILEKILESSKFNITKTVDLVIPTSTGSYIYPRIFVCELK